MSERLLSSFQVKIVLLFTSISGMRIGYAHANYLVFNTNKISMCIVFFCLLSLNLLGIKVSIVSTNNLCSVFSNLCVVSFYCWKFQLLAIEKPKLYCFLFRRISQCFLLAGMLRKLKTWWKTREKNVTRKRDTEFREEQSLRCCGI